VALGYTDLDHVVLPVAALAPALDQLAQLGLHAAPVQEVLIDDTRVTAPLVGLRHLIFLPPAGREDLANMIVLLEVAAGSPGPTEPFIVCAAEDIDDTHAAMDALGIASGAVSDVEPRVWSDAGSAVRFPVKARRLGMRPDVPLVVNASQAGDRRGYHHGPWQAHEAGIRRLAGVSYASGTPAAHAAWLAETVFGVASQQEAEQDWLVWPRDLFIRVAAAGSLGVGARATKPAQLVSLTLLVDDLDAWADAASSAKRSGWRRLDGRSEGGIVLRSPALPADVALIDRAILERMPGSPSAGAAG
jgi:hypothetical protein